ncbi:hypothetical protein PHYC_00094 [Phycisphaerales bacterium]|nr:hypothetical protein PHYC_00094 [Phycisphaerales bacterium]
MVSHTPLRAATAAPARVVWLPRRAYTLVEVAISIAILTVILLGAQSAVMIAAKSIPGEDDPVAVNSAVNAALSQMGEDLQMAVAITVMDAADVELAVPDRTGDGAPDTLRYTWSGKVGEPLTRAFNGGAPAEVVPGIQSFGLTYDKAEIALPTTYSDSGETLLYSYLTLTNSAARPVGKLSGSTYLRAMYFKPTLPADAVYWSISKVSFWARNYGNVDSVVQLQVRTTQSGAPTPRQYSASPFNEAWLGASWTRYDLANIKSRGLLPNQVVCLVFQSASGNDCIELLHERAVATTDAYALTSTNGGSSWSASTDCLVCAVYGSVTTPDAPATKTAVTGVGFTLQAGSESTPVYSGRWPLLNQP